MRNIKKLKLAILLLLLSKGLYAQSDYLKANVTGVKDDVDIAGISTYTNINDKSWDQILMENTFQWRPPYTVHLPIQPVHSPDWVYVDGALNAYRLHVTPIDHTKDSEAREAATTQETFIVQFAFDDPPFVPDFRLSNLSLADNKYPLATGDYHSRHIYYQIEYVCDTVSENQSLLWMRVSVTNEGKNTQQAHVRVKVNFQRENDLFDYHYIPFNWDASKWLPCDRVKLENNSILKDGRIIGKIVSESMEVDWESNYFQEKDYNKVHFSNIYQNCFMSGFITQPSLQLRNVQDVIHAQGELKPGEKRTFSLALLVNYENITESHLSCLEKSSAEESRAKAMNRFKNQFHKQHTEMSFQVGHWQDIFTALQISTLQLLVKYPDKESLMPTQGGSSERFFVWVWEAVHMLRPMLRIGHFEPVRKGIDYIFSLQDAGTPPMGRFTTTKGSVGTTGPRWINTTGAALALACDYYMYSNDRDFLDQYLPKILKAGRWIIGELRATRQLDPDGIRPPYYGIMPFGVAADGEAGYYLAHSDGYTFWGLEKTAYLLERIKHNDAEEFRRELELYRGDLAIAIKGLSHPNGFIDRKLQLEDKDTKQDRGFENVVSAASLAYTGPIKPESDIFQRFVSYFERNMAVDYFMGNMDREIAYMGFAEYYWQHIYLSTGQWKKAFAATQTNLKYGMTQDTYQVQERFSRRDPAFTCWQPNGSGNGRMIGMMLNSFYFESEQGVTLLGGIPIAWLQANQITSLRNLYTHSGVINLEIKATGPKTYIVSLSSADPSDHKALPRVIRFPEHLYATAKSSSIVNKGNGFFEVKGQPDNLIFILTSD